MTENWKDWLKENNPEMYEQAMQELGEEPGFSIEGITVLVQMYPDGDFEVWQAVSEDSDILCGLGQMEQNDKGESYIKWRHCDLEDTEENWAAFEQYIINIYEER